MQKKNEEENGPIVERALRERQAEPRAGLQARRLVLLEDGLLRRGRDAPPRVADGEGVPLRRRQHRHEGHADLDRAVVGVLQTVREEDPQDLAEVAARPQHPRVARV
jgi:hypothetical protein